MRLCEFKSQPTSAEVRGCLESCIRRGETRGDPGIHETCMHFGDILTVRDMFC